MDFALASSYASGTVNTGYLPTGGSAVTARNTGFGPIGNSDNEFTGSFDGNGFTISKPIY